jgi:hypothetical protein
VDGPSWLAGRLRRLLVPTTVFLLSHADRPLGLPVVAGVPYVLGLVLTVGIGARRR